LVTEVSSNKKEVCMLSIDDDDDGRVPIQTRKAKSTTQRLIFLKQR